jgi:hypothetical protein
MTNNPTRRLRQHNGELVGGAKYTKLRKGEGKWIFYGWIKSNNILIKNRALSLEKKIQINSRKQSGTPIQRRIKSIHKILSENEDLVFELNIIEPIQEQVKEIVEVKEPIQVKETVEVKEPIQVKEIVEVKETVEVKEPIQEKVQKTKTSKLKKNTIK